MLFMPLHQSICTSNIAWCLCSIVIFIQGRNGSSQITAWIFTRTALFTLMYFLAIWMSFLPPHVWCRELHGGFPQQVLFFNWIQNLCGGHLPRLCLITTTIAGYGVMNGQITPALFTHLWLSHCSIFKDSGKLQACSPQTLFFFQPHNPYASQMGCVKKKPVSSAELEKELENSFRLYDYTLLVKFASY